VLRRPFTFASAAPLVLCVATCVLWVRSYTWVDKIFPADYDDTGWRGRPIGTGVGRAWLRSVHEAGAVPTADPDESAFAGTGRTWRVVDVGYPADAEEVAGLGCAGRPPRRAGFSLGVRGVQVTRRTAVVVVPHAYPAAGTSVLPARTTDSRQGESGGALSGRAGSTWRERAIRPLWPWAADMLGCGRAGARHYPSG
jgi:hypothetical protein